MRERSGNETGRDALLSGEAGLDVSGDGDDASFLDTQLLVPMTNAARTHAAARPVRRARPVISRCLP
jgi:hypothetical protein